MTAEELFPVDAAGVAGWYRTRAPSVVRDVTGRPVAALSVVPSGYLNRTFAAVREAKSAPVDECVAAIERAGRIFADHALGGIGPAAYRQLVSRTSGLPISVVDDAAESIVLATKEIAATSVAGRPGTAVADWRHPGTHDGRALWCRRGEVLTVVAAGNSPAIHALWLEALALGYRVVVRPSSREPFTPHRLVTALYAAGIERSQLVFLPTTHAQVDDLISLADLAVVYGGDEVVRRYSADPKVSVQGPGRSKILITREMPWEEHLDVVVDSIASHAGTACINTTAVFTEHPPTELADAVAQRLSRLRDLPPDDTAATLPVEMEEDARRLASYLERRASGTRPVLGADRVVKPLGDGSAVLRPALHVVPDPRAEQTGAELPFPCAWFAPWEAADGITPLRNSLVVAALTQREELIDAMVQEPSIRNIHIGDRSTCWSRPGLPHDGFLSDFLMRSKAIARPVPLRGTVHQ